MTQFYINAAERTKIATYWIKVTLGALHVWATLLVLAALFSDRNPDVVEAMFSTCTLGIGLTLGILLLDRAADAVLSKFATQNPPAAVKETITREVTPAPSGDIIANDVTVKAEGSVNVGP